jgi:tRNA nucleotidyltransferase (CCA-adding enzyme)
MSTEESRQDRLDPDLMDAASSSAPPSWETFAHGADTGVRGAGPTLDSAFEQAALALTGTITDPHRVAAEERVDVVCRAPDRELLLYEWLNALVYEMDTRRMLFGRYEVEIDEVDGGRRLVGRAYGEPVVVARHQPAVEVKGATLTELEVAEEDGRWRAQCVVDV